MKSMISILFAICTAVVSSAMADTNAVVATAKKCPQTTLACMGMPVSDTAVSRELKAELKDWSSSIGDYSDEDDYKYYSAAFRIYTDGTVGPGGIVRYEGLQVRAVKNADQ